MDFLSEMYFSPNFTTLLGVFTYHPLRRDSFSTKKTFFSTDGDRNLQRVWRVVAPNDGTETCFKQIFFRGL